MGMKRLDFLCPPILWQIKTLFLFTPVQFTVTGEVTEVWSLHRGGLYFSMFWKPSVSFDWSNFQVEQIYCRCQQDWICDFLSSYWYQGSAFGMMEVNTGNVWQRESRLLHWPRFLPETRLTFFLLHYHVYSPCGGWEVDRVRGPWTICTDHDRTWERSRVAQCANARDAWLFSCHFLGLCGRGTYVVVPSFVFLWLCAGVFFFFFFLSLFERACPLGYTCELTSVSRGSGTCRNFLALVRGTCLRRSALQLDIRLWRLWRRVAPSFFFFVFFFSSCPPVLVWVVWPTSPPLGLLPYFVYALSRKYAFLPPFLTRDGGVMLLRVLFVVLVRLECVDCCLSVYSWSGRVLFKNVFKSAQELNPVKRQTLFLSISPATRLILGTLDTKEFIRIEFSNQFVTIFNPVSLLSRADHSRVEVKACQMAILQLNRFYNPSVIFGEIIL